MDSTRFDRVTRLFADRRLSRRQALAQGGAGLAAGALATTGLRAAAQDATPAPADGTPAATTDGQRIPYLFVQSFQGGTIAPVEDQDARYTVTLEHGLGQTIYFSDRPARDVGTVSTSEFLDGLGFPDDNPPNAALLVDSGDGAANIAVVELFNPVYDAAEATVTYELEVLADWEASEGLGEPGSDLSTLAADFGAAHLFIDDCPDFTAICQHFAPGGGYQRSGNDPRLGNRGQCWNLFHCAPCEEENFYQRECAAQFPSYCNAQTPCGVPFP